MYTIYHCHFGRPQMLGTFLMKRIIRIYPVYWIVNAAVIPIYFLFPSFGLGDETKPAVIIKSLLLWPQSNAPVLGVAWSLSYILFFYLMFSLAFIMNFRTVTAVFAVWLSIIAMHAYGWIHLKEDLLTRFLFDPVYAEFMLGAVLAYVVRKRNWQHGGAWIALGALMFPFAWLIRYDAPSLNYSNVYYTIGSSLALFGVSTINPKNVQWFEPLSFVGDASYSVLLTSLPFLSITLKLSRGLHLVNAFGVLATILICFAAAAALCCLFYKFIEKPLVRMMKKNALRYKTEASKAIYKKNT